MVGQLKEGFAAIAAIAITTTALAIGGYVAYSVTSQNESPTTDLNKVTQGSNYFTRNSTTTTQANTSEKQNSPVKPSNQRASKNSDSPSRKNYLTSKKSISQCDSINCINQKLSKCQQSTYKGAINLGSLGGRVEVQYKILGRKSNKCRVKLVYLENPNENWENKPLVCNYNTNKNIREASVDAMRAAMSSQQESGCSGKLLDTLPKPSVETAPGVDLINRPDSGYSVQKSNNELAEDTRDNASRVVGPNGVYAQITNWIRQDSALVDVSYGYKIGHINSACQVRQVGGAGSLSAPIDTTEYKCQGSTYEIKFYGKNPESNKNVFEITKQ